MPPLSLRRIAYGTKPCDALLSFNGHRSLVIEVAFSPDGTHIATASKDGTAKLWDTATGVELFTSDTARWFWLFGAVSSPDGTRAEAASDDTSTTLWDAVSDVEIVTFTGHIASLLSPS